jgi:hypothetical protein
VSEYAVSAPCPSAGEPVEQGAVPTGAALEVGDAAVASGTPLDEGTEGSAVLDGAAGGPGLALAGDGESAHPEGVQIGLDAGFAVAAVGGHLAGWPAGPAGDAGDGRVSCGASAGFPSSTAWSTMTPSALSTVVMPVGVVDDHVDPPLAGVAAVQVLGALQLDHDHDHAVAVAEHGMIGGGTVVEDLALRAERSLQPRDRRRDVAIGRCRVDAYRGVSFTIR